MWSKLARLSYQQLILLDWFVQHPDNYGTIEVLAKKTKLSGKALGGVLSSLSRAKYRGLPIIEPWGRPKQGSGLRWKLNQNIESLSGAKGEIHRLLAGY